MKLWRGLSRRILVVSVLCALLGLVLSQLFTMRAAREALRATVAPYLNRAFDDNQRRACESDPEHWSLTLEPGARLDAYDEQTLKSRNPSAPPLDDLLYKRLTLGEAHPVRFYRLGSEYGGALLMRTGTEGPCAIVQASLPPHPAARRWRSGILLGIGVVALALAACIGVVAAVRPLTRRIGRLRAAAQGVGTAGYGSAGDATGDELGELSQILDQAHERIRLDAQILQERQRALEQYLTDIAHDLRTPIGSLQIALEQALDVRSEKERGELLQTALKDVVYLAGLTNNLRLACQLRDGWDPVADNATCDLADVVERVAASGRVFAKRRGIALEVSRPDATVRVRCHPTAVEQAVRNIVENAISYGDPGGHVAVLLDVTRSAPSKASGDTASSNPKDRFFLSVIDDGPGVAPALLPRLGERTFRSDEARQRDPDGSGLGLAITSEICARSGWTILFGTATPRGLRVEIEGPVEPSSSPHGPQ